MLLPSVCAAFIWKARRSTIVRKGHASYARRIVLLYIPYCIRLKKKKKEKKSAIPVT
jgi:hypothetical protein